MNCDCTTPSVYRESNPIAAKDHKCCECSGVIYKGEKYHYVWGVWDGDAEKFHTCAECKSIREELQKTDSELIALGEMFECLENGDNPELLERYWENRNRRESKIVQNKDCNAPLKGAI